MTQLIIIHPHKETGSANDSGLIKYQIFNDFGWSTVIKRDICVYVLVLYKSAHTDKSVTSELAHFTALTNSRFEYRRQVLNTTNKYFFKKVVAHILYLTINIRHCMHKLSNSHPDDHLLSMIYIFDLEISTFLKKCFFNEEDF